MNSIPASQLVNVLPGVLTAGGNLFALNSVFYTQDSSIPIGTVQGFSSSASVVAWFGAQAPESIMAGVYFQGFQGANILPGTLYFVQYNIAAVGAYVRGGPLALTLTQLQALTGTLVTVVDGVSSTSLSINLSSATSFTNAAALIQTGIQGGSPTSTATCTYDSLRGAFVIHSASTGTTSTLAFVTGSLAAGLNFTSATGAVLSQGAAIDTPAAAVSALVALTQNWVTVTTTWEPSTSDKVAFATAVSAQGQRYAYVGWDSDVTPTQSTNATGSFGALTATLNGRIAVWGGSDKAAFICGTTASIDFTQTNGRITYAYKQQAGLVPEVTNATVATNLLANGYNFYGSYATDAQQFQFLQNGQISGVWLWVDPYINQIKLNSDLQVAFVTGLSQAKAVPYAQRGYTQIRAWAMGPINAALNFGSIVAGVILSPSQYAAVNAAAGLNIADTIQAQGWYLQILPAAPSTRTSRGSPPMTLWYTDGGSIQKINLSSIDIE